MSKIIGLITAWGAEKWIEPAIKQALEYCDEVLVVVACYHIDLMEFEDNTYDICKKYKDNVKLISIPAGKMKRTAILNTMLKKSSLFAVGNWVWLLDVDEFYPRLAYDEIKFIIDKNEHDYIRVEEKFFLINMQHYLKGSHGRLVKIKTMNDKYNSINNWSNKSKNLYILPRNNGMFHYSMLTNTNVHKFRWEIQERQMYKVRWLDKIYSNYDLDNEEHWVNKNKKFFGIKSPWYNKGFTPDKNGKLFKYDREHPELIEESGLTKENDFRVLL